MDTDATRAELMHFLGGYARTNPHALADLAALGDPVSSQACPWRTAAAREIERRLLGLMAGFSLPLLADVQSGAIDAMSVADQVSRTAKRPPATDPKRPALEWSGLSGELRELFSTIAHREMGISTLEVRSSDRLDFHDVGVVGARCALIAAYLAGRAAARR